MRLGWLAAAAALVLGAGQAQAARFYEFEVNGAANVADYYDGFNIRTRTYTDTIRFSFDTMVPLGQYGAYVAGGDTFNVYLREPSGSRGSLDTVLFPSGPEFSFDINLADVATGDALQAIPFSGNAFSYTVRPDPRYGYTVKSTSGQLYSVLARTSDVAPAGLGTVTQQLSINLLPEPASWAMTIVGFGLAGGALRRGRRSTRGKAQGRAQNRTALA